MNKLKKNKRGNVGDLIVIIAILFILGISWILGYTLLNKYKASVENKGSTTSNNILNEGKKTGSVLDNMIIFILIGLSLFSIISAYFIDSHPAFLFISIFVLVIIIVISASISNVYNEISNKTVLNETSQTQFTKTKWVVEHAPLIAIITGLLVLVILFGKWQSL